MNGRTLIPQQIPSFTKPLLQALAVIVGATLVFGALWARAEGGEDGAWRAPPADLSQ